MRLTDADDKRAAMARARADRPRKDPRITLEERSGIVNGLWPPLRRPIEEPCPFEVGETVHVSSAVAIMVLRITERDEKWRISYRIIDNRAEPYLASTLPQQEKVIDKDRSWSFDEEHGYSGSPNAGLVDGGRRVPRRFQERLSMEAGAESAWTREQRRLEAEKLAAEGKLERERRPGGSRSTARKLTTRIETLEKRLNRAA